MSIKTSRTSLREEEIDGVFGLREAYQRSLSMKDKNLKERDAEINKRQKDLDATESKYSNVKNDLKKGICSF